MTRRPLASSSSTKRRASVSAGPASRSCTPRPPVASSPRSWSPSTDGRRHSPHNDRTCRHAGPRAARHRRGLPGPAQGPRGRCARLAHDPDAGLRGLRGPVQGRVRVAGLAGAAGRLLSERALYVFFRTAGHTPRAERIVKTFSKLGEHGLVWQGIALTGAAVDRDRRAAWLRAWGVIAASFGVNQVVKLAIRRPRPDLPELPRLMGTMSNRSYPSAHATTSAAAARSLSPLLQPVLGTAAAPMSLSRLYLGLHWPSYVVAGYALGAAVGELAS